MTVWLSRLCNNNKLTRQSTLASKMPLSTKYLRRPLKSVVVSLWCLPWSAKSASVPPAPTIQVTQTALVATRGAELAKDSQRNKFNNSLACLISQWLTLPATSSTSSSRRRPSRTSSRPWVQCKTVTRMTLAALKCRARYRPCLARWYICKQIWTRIAPPCITTSPVNSSTLLPREMQVSNSIVPWSTLQITWSEMHATLTVLLKMAKPRPWASLTTPTSSRRWSPSRIVTTFCTRVESLMREKLIESILNTTRCLPKRKQIHRGRLLPNRANQARLQPLTLRVAPVTKVVPPPVTVPTPCRHLPLLTWPSLVPNGRRTRRCCSST